MIILINANALHIPLADNSVQCCVTSPPYWGLRSYDTGDNKAYELGAEPTPDEYVAHMVQVFREVWRVLRDDGTLWLNLGDSYSSGMRSSYDDDRHKYRTARAHDKRPPTPANLKPKDLIGIPWRVAFALQADGWYLRSEITWCKRNPMPESVSDRPTSATEKIFLFSKSPRYFFDAEAVREGFADERMGQDGGKTKRVRNVGGRTDGFTTPNGWTNEYGNTGRNIRNFWLLSSEPFPGAHFATFPTEIPRRAIKAGTSEAGCCSTCGAPYERVTKQVGEVQRRWSGNDTPTIADNLRRDNGRATQKVMATTGFRPTCDHDAQPVPCTVLDPFAGSGTTGIVARQLGRRFVGLDLSFTYLHDIARRRLGMIALDEWTNGIKTEPDGYHDLPLFLEAK